MKKNMMLVGLMMLSTIIFAQRSKGDPIASAAKKSDRMKTELTLNDAQYAKVKAINEKFETGQMKIRSDTSLTKGTSHKKMESLKSDQNAQLKAALTEAQWTKWTTLKEEKKGHHRGGHKRGHK